MEQDLRRFNRTLIAIGIVIAGLIIIFSFRYADTQRSTVLDFVSADSLIHQRWFQNLDQTDSLQIQQFAGKEVLLTFWATWSESSTTILYQLKELQTSRQDSLIIIAAAVKDNGQEARSFIENAHLPFHFVDGTIHYLDLRMVGVPSAILFNESSKPVQILVGEKQLVQFTQSN
jgi:hypothetical protein